jgi:predicted dehydrogenase
MTKKFNVCIVGAGIGERHAVAFERLRDQFHVALICDADLARGGKLADQLAAAGLPRPALAKDYRDAAVVADNIDIVDICIPPWLHFDAMKVAIAAGKQVICEKPLAASLTELDEIERLAKAKGIHVMPVFQYRFGHGLAKAKQLMSSGAAGKVYMASIETHWTRGPDYYAVQWRGKKATELGGLLAGHAIHAHDMLTHLVGEVRAVSAMTAVRVNPVETEDCAGALFEMADGSIAVSSATLGSADEISRIRIACENVTMISSLGPYTPSRDPWTFIPKAPKDQAFIDKALAGVTLGEEGYTEQFAGYHASLTTGAPLPITWADGRRSIEVLTALYHSAKVGQKVALPLGTSHPAYKGWLNA